MLSVTPAIQRPATILVADDDTEVRALIRVQLEEHGYAVAEATDGRSALSVAASEPIDLVLADIGMPGADGYELLRMMRKAPRTATTPVVFITGRSPATEAAKALGLGAHDYLRKPLDPGELVARVEAALRVKARQDQMQRRSADLELLNRTDPLTGLFNRRHLVEQLRAMADAGRRSRVELCVLMADIDHFKAVNDGWGHQAGDQVLSVVAERLQRALRGADVAGRWGGEEFLVLLPATTLDDGLKVAERIRRDVGGPLVGEVGSLPPGVTVSIGGASGSGGDQATAIIRQADAALYRAKAAGRDRVEGYTQPGAGQEPTQTIVGQGADEPDRRVAAALAMMAGGDDRQVAADHGVGVEVVRRWHQLFVEGGRDRVASRRSASTRRETATWPSSPTS